jgi:hypothetical protein
MSPEERELVRQFVHDGWTPTEALVTHYGQLLLVVRSPNSSRALQIAATMVRAIELPELPAGRTFNVGGLVYRVPTEMGHDDGE